MSRLAGMIVTQICMRHIFVEEVKSVDFKTEISTFCMKDVRTVWCLITVMSPGIRCYMS